MKPVNPPKPEDVCVTLAEVNTDRTISISVS